MTTFVDGIVLTQKHSSGTVRELAGVRSLVYRGAGDINRDGDEVEEEEVIGENYRHAWIQGSHSTAIRVKSEDGLVSICGNPGRWSRPDNLFNADLIGTVEAANHIARLKGLPDFEFGEAIGSARLEKVLLPGASPTPPGGMTSSRKPMSSRVAMAPTGKGRVCGRSTSRATT